MENRQALEDAVYDFYPEFDMADLERMPREKLQYLLDLKNGRKKLPSKESATPMRPKTIREKVGERLEVRSGVLVHVEDWRISNAAGIESVEYVQQCGERVTWEGQSRASSIVRHFLLTGEWVKRVPKPSRYRAVLRRGREVLHLGYFASVEERDTAVGLARLGIFPNGLK